MYYVNFPYVMADVSATLADAVIRKRFKAFHAPLGEVMGSLLITV